MKLDYRSRNGQFGVQFDASSPKELFEQVALFQEIFEQEKCGACKSENTRFSVREVEGNKFYELVCNDCACKLSFGCHKKTPTLFPKRTDDEGNYVGKFGWHKFDKSNKQKT